MQRLYENCDKSMQECNMSMKECDKHNTNVTLYVCKTVTFVHMNVTSHSKIKYNICMPECDSNNVAYLC